MVVRSLKLSNVSVLVGPGISCTKTQALFNLRLPISSDDKRWTVDSGVFLVLDWSELLLLRDLAVPSQSGNP